MSTFSSLFDPTQFFLNYPPLEFQFFGIPVRIFSDSSSFFNIFTETYKYFQSNNNDTSIDPPLVYSLITNADNIYRTPILVNNGSVMPLNDAWFIQEGFVYETILNDILNHVRRHILVHAGVIALNSQGVILVADSGHGKTTLVMELVRRGFDLLSDELAAFSRSDGLLYPFPRCLRIRPTTLPLLNDLTFPESTVIWGGKLLVDPDTLRPGCIGKPCPPHAVLFLKSPSIDDEVSSANPGREIVVMVTHLEQGLLTFIANHSDTLAFDTDIGQKYPTIRIRTKHVAIASEIESYCLKHDILILDLVRRDPSPPVFGRSASLEEIPMTQALVELIRRFEPGHSSDLMVKDYNGQSSRMFFELASILKNTRAFYLTPGPLPQMANLVESLLLRD